MKRNRVVKPSSRKKPAARGARASQQQRSRTPEIVGVASLGLAFFLFAGMLSLQLGDGGLMGPFGRACATLLYGIAGIGGYVVAAGLGLVAVRLLMGKDPVARGAVVLGIGLGVLAVNVLLQLVAGGYLVAGYGPGGQLGAGIGELLRSVVSTAGTALLALVALLVAVVVATPLRMGQVLGLLGRVMRESGIGAMRGARKVGGDVAGFSGEVIRAVLPEKDHDEYEDDYDDEEEEDGVPGSELVEELAQPPIIDRTGRHVMDEADASDTVRTEDADAMAAADSATAGKRKRGKRNTSVGLGEVRAPATGRKGKKAAAAASATDIAGGDQATDAGDEEDDDAITNQAATAPATAAATAADDQDTDAEATAPAAAAKGGASTKADDSAAGPVIVESQFRHPKAVEMKAKEEAVDKNRLGFIPLGDGDFQLPPVNLLEYDETQAVTLDRTAMLEMSAKLITTLENYGIKGEVAAIRPGPVVTMYEFAPAPGTRVNKIVNLADDLAMSLEALKVRIVAPIPGKAVVGIEVPNKSRETVYLKEILADDTFQQGKAKLPLALGKNIEGAPIVCDMAKMPHLLVAGATGSGKSVAVNTMITSLLYSCTPEEVRFIMVDPKVLELSIYEGVPHLLLPVVTDPKKANLALRWAVDEMERRYELLARMGVRDIASYNKKVAKLAAKHEADALRAAADKAERALEGADEAAAELAVSDDDIQQELELGDEPTPEVQTKLPFIVVVIDEFADLMMCAPKEVETSVARIAQKARAAGIHLLLATQRPSVDVITGLIKANFPSRIAFHVTSKVDSRTILDQMGAENLLGAGDMLFSDRGQSPERLHGCYVNEEEIARVVEFLKKQGRPSYNYDILKPRDEDGDEDGGSGDGDGDGPDDLYDRAVRIVAEAQRVSVSYLQRRLSVGYNRAAKMVERMEREGVVSAPDVKKVREVLIQAA